MTSTNKSEIDILHDCAEQVFANVLNPTTAQFQPLSDILGEKVQELDGAIASLRDRELSPSIEADLEFILGRKDYESNGLESALKHYRKSLNFWQQAPIYETTEEEEPENCLLKQEGAIFFEIGFCYFSLAGLNSESNNRPYWEKAHNNFRQCFGVLEKAKGHDLVAKFISKDNEVLQKLEEWDELENMAQKALELHISYGSEGQIARDYGFLAEAAIHQSKWVHANQLVQLAIAIQSQSFEGSWDAPQDGNYYLELLSQSQHELELWQATVNRLEEGRKQTDPQKNLDSYLQILNALQKLYFDQDEYGKAAALKEEKIKIKHKYGLQAFIGVGQLSPPQSSVTNQMVAREIEASDRLKDVNNLIARIGSDRHKLTVIYGNSGVGKSSLLNAGLVPMLLQPGAIDNRVVLPIILRVYTDWLREPDPETWNLTSVLNSLRQNDDPNQLKVLIFDQFEEFFQVCTQIEQRLPFYEFLCECLSLKSVKVVLAMRTDCLHYLLEGDRLTNLEEAIDCEILSKQVLYYLGNFSSDTAKMILQNLCETTQLKLESEQIDEIVKDLAVELDEVRPIELQLVGAQLQSKGITTRKKYRELGDNPKQKLIEQFLDEVIKNTGIRNERTAILVLYLLTNENGTRPLKTRAQIAADLLTDSKKLDWVLDVLVKEGLVLLLSDVPDDRYQLAHDYLIFLIREQKGERLIAELVLEKDKLNKKLIEERPNNFLDRAIASVFNWMRVD